MKCIVCQGTDIARKTVDEEIRSGNDIVLLPLDLLVCSECGERYYDRRDMQKIEDVRTRLREKMIPLAEVGKVFRAKAA